MESEYLDCEVFVSGRHQARLSVGGRDYSGFPRLDTTLEQRLRELTLEPSEYGQLLFDALFPADGDSLLEGYRESLTLARHQSHRLRIRLHIAIGAPPALHGFHWELLRDGGRQVTLSRSKDLAFSRYQGAAFEPAIAVVGQPRLLIAFACPENLADYGLPVFDRGELQNTIETALRPLHGHVSVAISEGPTTLQGLRDQLLGGSFHALHLVAHGLLSRSGTAHLLLEDAEGQVDLVDEQRFTEVFEGQRELRLVTLMACHSGAPSNDDPFSGLARGLVQKSVPAVLAMRRSIPLDAAHRFTEHFYRNLARRGQIDVAVNEARLQLYLAEPTAMDWGTPALFMHLRDGCLWQLESTAEDSPVGAPETVLRTLMMVRDLEVQHPDVRQRHGRLLRDVMRRYGGREVGPSSGFLMLFDRPVQAVGCALDYQRSTQEWAQQNDLRLTTGVGLHLGEVVLSNPTPEDLASGAQETEVHGTNREIVHWLADIAQPGQTLLTRGAFDLTRQGSLGHLPNEVPPLWLAHGEFLMPEMSEPISIFEVGCEDWAPLEPPQRHRGARRAHGQDTLVGWRPAQGLTLPQRPHWTVERQLGTGGFGEVWLLSHDKTDERRVFKFCYEASKLHALRREITLFRLLKEELGERRDIARILDWDFEEAPYFIESEYAEGGNLVQWIDTQGGMEQIPLERRLDLIAQVATALAAAHSVGVLHKDVKPANVLVVEDAHGNPQVRLSDFGIGAVIERQRLAAAGITMRGWTETDTAESSGQGTRLYLAPEVLEGRPPTMQADIFALGVMLYQVLAGDLSRALAPGWRRDMPDAVLCEDIAAAVDRSPQRRLGDAQQLAERLRTLDARRREREQAQQERDAQAKALEELEAARRRRNLFAVAGVALALFALAMTVQMRRVAREAETTRQVTGFVEALFEASNPEESLGEDITVREIFDRGAEQVRAELHDQPEVQARLLHLVGTVYQGLGIYEQAVVNHQDALTLRQDLFGPSHPLVAESLHVLGEAYWYGGKLKEAEKPAREALEQRRRLLGPTHVDIAESLHNLSWILREQGKLEPAEPLFEEALAMRRELLGDHLKVANSLNSLAGLLVAKGNKKQYEIAEQRYLESLALRRRLLRQDDLPEDRSVATTLCNLAELYRITGRLKEAEARLREALELHRQLLGEDHPEVATNLNNLALTLHFMQRLDEAEPFYREALDIRRRVFGDQDIRVASTVNNLAALLHKQGKLTEAEPLYRDALATREALLDETHYNVVNGLTNLARVLLDLGRPSEAEPLLRRAVHLAPESFPEGHWRMAFVRGTFGACLGALDQPVEGEALLAEAHEILAETLGEQSLYTQEIQQRLSRIQSS